MSIDVFGRRLVHADVSRGPPGLGFKLTADGNFDIENRKLCNVGDAVDQDDAVNLKSMKKIINRKTEKIIQDLQGLETLVNDKIRNFEAEFARINNKLSDLQENDSKSRISGGTS